MHYKDLARRSPCCRSDRGRTLPRSLATRSIRRRPLALSLRRTSAGVPLAASLLNCAPKTSTIFYQTLQNCWRRLETLLAETLRAAARSSEQAQAGGPDAKIL